jgi:hypothetical protein
MLRENLSIFIRRFGQEVTFEFEGGTERTVQAIFDNAFFDTSVGETVLDTTQPRLTCRTEDIEGIPRETHVVVNGQRYSVIQFQPDGTGISTVALAHE